MHKFRKFRYSVIFGMFGISSGLEGGRSQLVVRLCRCCVPVVSLARKSPTDGDDVIVAVCIGSGASRPPRLWIPCGCFSCGLPLVSKRLCPRLPRPIGHCETAATIDPVRRRHTVIPKNPKLADFRNFRNCEISSGLHLNSANSQASKIQSISDLSEFRVG